MEPALPTGGTVMVTMERDGAEVAEAGQTITVTEPAPCVWGTLPGLEPGHYRMIYTISPSQMPPASGEFDITPAESGSAAATTSATDTALAKRIIGSLDALAALVVKDDELLTTNWVIDEAQWITDNTAALMDQGGSLERFYDEHTALLDIVGAGGDQTEAIGRLLSLRDEIAIEFTLPTLPPS
jgi:hypothetical protein